MKRLSTLILLALLITTLTGCAQKTFKMNIQAFSDVLVTTLTFQDELTQIDSALVSKLYEIPEGTEVVIYVGSGATAEEVSVFECADSTSAETMLANAKTHIEDQILSFADYIPEEVKKLDSAIVKREGNYVIVCVVEDSTAAMNLIDQTLKEAQK